MMTIPRLTFAQSYRNVHCYKRSLALNHSPGILSDAESTTILEVAKAVAKSSASTEAAAPAPAVSVITTEPK